ncbi:sensor histidine kinase [Amycolatopsis anabasis]|uniref:sensor histidine kinase n=1 Tax=Amycolatopsis anabasis TaxID=1840409 RepID=UPI00131E9489|nr:nitrate- and nitrite sensing domain-containing protein [Amycolatopsis anabasis]
MTRRQSRPRQGDATDSQAVKAAGGRWRLRNWRLRTKLLVVVLIPTLTVLALIGFRVRQDLDHATQLAQLAAHGRVDDAVADVVHQVQRERDLTVRFVSGGRKADPVELRRQRDRVDASIATLGRELDSNAPRLSESGAAGLRKTQAQFGVLTGLRFAGEHSAFPADAVLRSYSELISGLLDMSDQAVTDVTDPDLARLKLADNALARVKDQMSIKRAVLADALEQGSLSGARLRALLGAEAELAAARNDFRKFASPQQQRMYDDTVIGLIVDQGNDLVESALTRAENDQPLAGLDPAKWDTAATYTVNLARKVQEAMQVQTQQRTDALAAQARTSAIVDAGAVFGVLLIGGILTVIIARSLLRPLRILRASALDVAEHRLPAAVEGILADPEPRPEGVRRWVAPVPVFSREELGQVARAFDAVYGEAVRLAGDQALLRENVNAMFVNLSRRSQDLVERQLSVLDRMEADEQDSETLGGLFELDHLATRMRRNSENLLVLSGHDLGNRVPGSVAADEILGAALSEVEHYQRIELTATPALAVRGDAASDLVHVISELLENATLYSPDDTMVTVGGTVTRDGGWEVSITDRGAGMPQAEIERANARLAEPPEVDVEVSRRMGLYVVSQLSRRHHIDVWLGGAEGGGLVATVLVPADLVDVSPVQPEQVIPVEVVPAPEPPPEPVVELPMPEELPSLPLLSEEPPRRAPVADEPAPEWPTEENDPHPLDLDAPTERMPAYQEVLSQWFASSRDRLDDDSGPLPRADASRAATEGWQRPGVPPWPAAADLAGALGENGDHAAAQDPDLGDPDAPTVPEIPVQPADSLADKPVLSREPEAVRVRMAQLQYGVERGRHARAESRERSSE